MILIDTNVLLRMVQPGHSMHRQAMSVVADLRAQGETLSVVPQVSYEFWVVATRPAQANGLGMSAARADADLAEILHVVQRGRFQTILPHHGDQPLNDSRVIAVRSSGLPPLPPRAIIVTRRRGER